MLRGKDDAALYLAFGDAGQHAHKVKDKLAAAVRDNGEVGISALGNFGLEFNLELVFGFLIIHIVLRLRVICGAKVRLFPETTKRFPLQTHKERKKHLAPYVVSSDAWAMSSDALSVMPDALSVTTEALSVMPDAAVIFGTSSFIKL